MMNCDELIMVASIATQFKNKYAEFWMKLTEKRK